MLVSLVPKLYLYCFLNPWHFNFLCINDFLPVTLFVVLNLTRKGKDYLSMHEQHKNKQLT